MSGLEILKYFCPILDKKDPPEDKEIYSTQPSAIIKGYTHRH